MGLIKYKQPLKDKIIRKEIVSSEEECEIRAASIISCEKLRKLLDCCNSVELDFYLWVILGSKSYCTAFNAFINIFVYYSRNTRKKLKMKSI